jgi:23S rRNA (pseudouridine1915-N3)-methyltransferase
MIVNMLSIGDKPPQWLQGAIDVYKKRLTQNLSLRQSFLKPTKIQNKTIKQQEKLIKNSLGKNQALIVMDEKGLKLNSTEYAKKIKKYMLNHQDITMIIGPSDGLSQEIKAMADEIWSLSSLTFAHKIVQLIVAEQTYRAWTLIKNHPYHRT